MRCDFAERCLPSTGLARAKLHFFPLQFAERDIEAMRQVKLRLDPQWLLGQGTLFGVGGPGTL